MAGLLVVLFPFVLLGFMILMERVESPLRTVAVEDRLDGVPGRAPGPRRWTPSCGRASPPR